MKTKIKFICLLLMCILMLVGCSKYPFNQQEYDEYSLLKRIETYEYKSDEIYEQTNISIDKETGVNYIVIMGAIKGKVYVTITPRYGSDGNVIITQ